MRTFQETRHGKGLRDAAHGWPGSVQTVSPVLLKNPVRQHYEAHCKIELALNQLEVFVPHNIFEALPLANLPHEEFHLAMQIP